MSHNEEALLVHGEPTEPQRLAPLAFLVGEFEGEGWFGDEGSRVRKCVRGAWVAERQHLTLDMTVDYLLADGRIDRHGAFVVVSAVGSRVEARAYTDAGARRDFVLAVSAKGVEFEDRVPPKMDGAGARKRLIATEGGYDEVLDVLKADGSSERCSLVRLLASPRGETRTGPA